MALSGIQWQELAVLSRELDIIRHNKPKDKRTPEDQAIVDYFKLRVADLEEQKVTRTST